MTLDELARHFRGPVKRDAKGRTVFCPVPAHADGSKHGRQSLRLTETPATGGLHVECYAGCDEAAILRHAHLTLADLAPEQRRQNGHHAPRPEIVKTYPYTDAAGTVLYETVRYQPKDFRQRRPDGAGGSTWDLQGVRLVLYRLPDLVEAPRVYWTEGERDADAVAALGLIATTTCGGADGFGRADYAAQIAALGVREVVCLPDNDPPGAQYADAVARACAAAGLVVKRVALPGVLPKGDVSDWLAQGGTRTQLEALADAAPPVADTEPAAAPDYLEPIAAFLAEPDAPLPMLFPDLLPVGMVMLLHGEPRARKSLAAFELALAAATGTAPFGLARFAPAAPVAVLYVQEEDPRGPTRARLRRFVQERCGSDVPATLHVAVRRGVDLDDPVWRERLIADCTRLGVRLLVLDAARRLSTKTDEGPSKVRELLAVLRAIVTRAGVTIVIVHHDVKPPVTGQDQRRRSQRASGGDWFAGCECPVHVERVNERESLVYPQDYKFSTDPAPFTFTCVLDGRLIARLIGRDTTTDHAETAGERGKLLDWLRVHGSATKTDLRGAGVGWTTLSGLLDGLQRDGLIDAGPGRTKTSLRYFVVPREDASRPGDAHAP